MAQETWSATRDTKEAAALSTMGVRVRIDKAVDGKSGKEYYTFYLGAEDDDSRRQVARLRKMYREKELARQAPKHPMVWCLVALRNRERVLDLVNQGRFVRSVPLVGGQFILRDSDTGLPGLPEKSGVVMRVKELELAVSLVTLGVPLLSCSGPKGDRLFHFANTKPSGKGMEVPNVYELVYDYRKGRLAAEVPEHPLLYAMLAQYNRAKLIKAMREQVQMVIVQKPRSMKSALVRADASDPAWDRVQRHFGM
jgi:hypothetical protein